MAKQKRINKSLVAFLTIMGMVLTVSVVTLVVHQVTQRDPSVLADQARDLEQSGEIEDLAQAARLYQQAYAATGQTDTKYVRLAADCLFRMGELGGWLDMLRRAHAKFPTDENLIIAILDGLWRVREIQGVTLWSDIWQEYGNKLLELDPDNPQGLVAKAFGIWAGVDEEVFPEGDAAAQRAYELHPENPRVAVAYVTYLHRQKRERVAQARHENAPARVYQQIDREEMDRVVAALAQAVDAHPNHTDLVQNYAAELRRKAEWYWTRAEDKTAPELHQTCEAALAEARQRLTHALEQNPDDPDLHLAMGRNVLVEYQVRRDQLTPAQRADLAAEIGKHAGRAIDLEPAMYSAYELQANVSLLTLPPDDPTVAQQYAAYDAALNRYKEAAEATLLLQNVRARLTEGRRLLLLHRAFNTALAEVALAAGEENDEKEQQALAHAKGFLEDAQTKWPENPICDYMEGRFLIITEDLIGATKAFERAFSKQASAEWWLSGAMATNLPTDHLAMLYRRMGETGEALKYTELAIQQYEEDLGRLPPAHLLIYQADFYIQLGRARDALDLLRRYQGFYADDQRIDALRATARTALARELEAQADEAQRQGDQRQAAELEAQANQLLERARVETSEASLSLGADEETSVAARIWHAQMALEQDDYETSLEVARTVLDDTTATDRQFQSAFYAAMTALNRLDRRDDAVELLDTLAERGDRPRLVPMFERYRILLAVDDPEERNRRWQEVIASIDDPLQRAEQYYAFHVSRQEYDQALPYLRELQKLQPDNLGLVEREFRIRLARGELDQAEALIPRLAQAEDGAGYDQAGGATYRGYLAMARDNPQQAIQEFRQALLALPKSAALQVQLGQAYLTVNRVDEAIEAFQRAAEINPRNRKAHGYLTSAFDQRALRAVGAEREQYEALAEKHFQELARLAPDNPYVRQRRQRLAEEADPLSAVSEREQQVANNPQDIQQRVRLADLYRQAWLRANAAGDQATRDDLAQRADELFASVPEEATEDDRLALAQAAAGFYAATGQTDQGLEFLRAFRDAQTGRNQLLGQLLVARFHETQRQLDAAEQAYQQAQRMVNEVISDPTQRAAEDVRVGMAFIEFYQRWARPSYIVEVCRWMLDRLPADSEAMPQVRRQLIEALLDGQRLSDAESEIEAYIRDYGTDLAVLTRRAQLRLRRNERAAARSDLTAILTEDPTNVWALLARGALAMQQAQYDAAREDFDEARDLVVPGSRYETRMHSLRASLYERTGQLGLAITELRELLNVYETARVQPVLIQQVVGQMVRLHRRRDAFDEAQKLISQYMEKYSQEPAWPYQLGELFAERAASEEDENPADAQRDYNMAARYYQRAAEESRGRFPNAFVRATAAQLDVLTKADRPREAVQLFERLPIQPTPSLRLAVAKAHWELNERDQARQQWHAALMDAAGDNIASLGAVAHALRESLLPGDAESLIRAAADGTPIQTPPGRRLRITLAEHLSRTGNPTAALPILTAVIEQTPPDSTERLAALLTRGAAEESAGDTSEAVQTYREVLENHPDHIAALNNLAYLLVTAEGGDLPRPAEALRYAEHLETLVSGDAAAANLLDTIGWVYFKYAQQTDDGDEYLERALASLEQAVNLGAAGNLAAQKHLARVYIALGRTADARDILRRALDLARDADDRDQMESIQKLMQELR